MLPTAEGLEPITVVVWAEDKCRDREMDLEGDETDLEWVSARVAAETLSMLIKMEFATILRHPPKVKLFSAEKKKKKESPKFMLLGF